MADGQGVSPSPNSAAPNGAPTQLSPSDFAAKVRAKYPGAYTDLDDVTLTNRILAKYPQYRSQVTSQPTPVQNPFNAAFQKAQSIGPAPSTLDRLRAGQVPGLDEMVQGMQTAGQPTPGTTGLAPQPTMMGRVGQTVGMLTKNPAAQADIGTFGPQATEAAIPSSTRAGANLNAVTSAIGKHTVDISDAGNTALRALELNQRAGFQLPSVIRRFLTRASNPDLGPITFEEARDMYSGATKLSIDESKAIKGQMKALVPEFAAKLGDALEETAARANRVEQYVQGLKEYSSAKNIEGAASELWTRAKQAAGAAVLAGAGYEGWEQAKKIFSSKPR